MGNISDYYRKGGDLMMQALKAYEEGEFDKGDKLRHEANQYYDLAEGEVNSEEGMIKMMYGEARNFGIMYNIFEQNLTNMLKQGKGKEMLKEFYSLLKHNKTLNEEFRIYDTIENAEDVDNAEDFVNEISTVIKTFDKKKVINENNKFLALIKKHKLNEYVEIPEETENLYEAIEYMLLNKKSLNNVNDYVKSKEVIKEHVEKTCKQKLEEDKLNTIDGFKEVFDKVQEGIGNMMEEDEENLIETYLNPQTNKEQFFNEQKEKTLNKINEAMENAEEHEQKEQWGKIYENVKAKKFTENDGLTLCAEMIEIYNTI